MLTCVLVQFSRPCLCSRPAQPHNKTITFKDTSEIQGLVSTTTLPYDYLVYAVGAETQTFNIPGVREHACFMKELDDAEKVRVVLALLVELRLTVVVGIDATEILGL